MKVCGFTIVKNAVKYQYPIVEVIQSALPIVKKFYVAIGEGEDNTEEIIRSIGSDKIEIISTKWENKGHYFISIETNKCFDNIPKDYDWAVYLQADEVLHENDHQLLISLMEKYLDNKAVDGFLFHFKHFWGNFDYVCLGRPYFRRDVRIIRNDKKIRSWHDAQGFRKSNNRKLTVVKTPASIYHYGWVRHPRFMQKKMENAPWNKAKEQELFDYNTEYESVINYNSGHPNVMDNYEKAINWNVNIDTSKNKLNFKNKLMLWFEKKTGHRLFENQHFHIYGKRKRLTNIWDE